MYYYKIHVTYGSGDSDGYTIPIAVNGLQEDAIDKAEKENLFIDPRDVLHIDYIEEITREEYESIIYGKDTEEIEKE